MFAASELRFRHPDGAKVRRAMRRWNTEPRSFVTTAATRLPGEEALVPRVP